MVEDAGDVEAFAEFTVEDAGGDKVKPAEDKKGGQEAAESSEPPVHVWPRALLSMFGF